MSHILPFIEFCADSYPDAKEITKEMLDHWLLTKNFNADSTRRIAIINIRHFARFLNAIGKKAYIPPSEYNVKAQRYLPYIFTDEELVQLFDSIDSLTNRIDRQEYHPELILPVVFRLELCCGMRPGEPFNLKTEDIDLKTGDIFIRKSKRGKDRLRYAIPSFAKNHISQALSGWSMWLFVGLFCNTPVFLPIF